ncbi:MAG: hypothetical protein KGS72_06470 [Cyanobacteria bacterium REEB67]|nr:hypothetical protein [Cyanobacteria bacterium REEB67]
MAFIDHTFNLSGNVRHQGLSLAQVEVFLYDLYRGSFEAGGDEAVASMKTGARGEFSFSVKPGVYRLEVVPDGKTRFLAQSVPEVKVTTNTSLNISLSTGCIVKGQLATGYGFEGNRSELFTTCEVIALGIEPTSYKAISPVDETGAFSLIIPRGKYYFASRSPRFVSTDSPIFNVGSDCDLTLGLPSFVTFEGEVVDHSGNPIEGAQARISPSPSSQNVLFAELNMHVGAVTDSAGRFDLALQEGAYDIAIEPAAGSTHFALKECEVEVAGSPEVALRRRFTMQEGYRLKGRVRFSDQPLSQALIRVQATGTKAEYIARTDGDGRFALSLPGGTYKIIAAAHPKDAPAIIIDGHEYSSLAPWTRAIVVGGNTQLDVELIEGTALLGRICDDAMLVRPGVRVQIFAEAIEALEVSDSGDQPEDGSSEPKTEVVSKPRRSHLRVVSDAALAAGAADVPDAPDANSTVLASGITDGEGKFGIFLSPGNYWLVIHRDFANAKHIRVGVEPVLLDVTWHGWSQLSFEVVGDRGQCVPRCQVFYHPYGQEMDDKPPLASSAMPLPYGYVMTNEEGHCRLTLPAGVYTFKFSPPDAGSYGPKVIRQLSISSDMSRKVTLESKQVSAATAGAKKGNVIPSEAGREED